MNIDIDDDIVHDLGQGRIMENRKKRLISEFDIERLPGIDVIKGELGVRECFRDSPQILLRACDIVIRIGIFYEFRGAVPV